MSQPVCVLESLVLEPTPACVTSPAAPAIPGVEIVSVSNRSTASSERVANEFGIPKVVERWQDLVASPDIDAVMIEPGRTCIAM